MWTDAVDECRGVPSVVQEKQVMLSETQQTL